MLDLCGKQPALLHKLIKAYNDEPLLQGTTVFDDITLGFIQRTLAAQGHQLTVLKKHLTLTQGEG